MTDSHQGRLVEEKNGYGVIECGACGFTHLDPIPAREALGAIYPSAYYETENPDWIQKTLGERDYWMLIYGEQYDTFEHFIRTTPRRLLDVGAFLGLFLEYGRQRGWDTIGIEPSDVAVRFAAKQGLHVLHGFFDAFEDAAIGPVDVVNLALTLEHVQDPAAVLARAHRLLRPGGLVCIEVPNDFNPLQGVLQRTLAKPRYWLAPPHHVNYFSFESLTRLVSRTGFEVVQRETTFPMEFFVLMGDDYVGNEPVGRVCHAKRMSFETALIRGGLGEFKRELYRFMAERGVGREVVLYARKRDE